MNFILTPHPVYVEFVYVLRQAFSLKMTKNHFSNKQHIKKHIQKWWTRKGFKIIEWNSCFECVAKKKKFVKTRWGRDLVGVFEREEDVDLDEGYPIILLL